MLKQLSLLIVCICTVTISFAQSNAVVRGKILTSDGQPAPFVTVRIDKTMLGDITNDKGDFTIKNVKPGSYKIKVTNLVSTAQEKDITVVAGQTLQVDFQLKENTAQLNEVTVNGRNANMETKTVAKLPLTNLENPQVYQVVTLETMKQQNITNFDDALRNVPGISRTWESTGRGGDGAAYFALRGFEAQPTLYNGLPGITNGTLDPASIESIEVIKGPSGTLFGGSFYGYGGIINTITKKPYNTFGGEVAYNLGSFGLHRITADINTPLDKNDKLAMRVNAAYHREGSFQDAGKKESFFIAPSFSYKANNRLSFSLIAEILQEERAVPPVFFHSDRATPLQWKTVKELNLNNKASFTSNDLTIKNPRLNIQGQMLYKLSSQWNSQTVISKGRTKSAGIYSYIWDDEPGDQWFNQYFHDEGQTVNTFDVQQNFTGDFKIAGVRNRLLVGIDFYQRKADENSSGWASGRYVNPQGQVATQDPSTGAPLPKLNLTRAAIDSLLAPGDRNISATKNSYYSVYFSDVLNITRNLDVMLSLRGDYFKTKDYDQFALSPKIGVVYQPILNKLSIFANYMNAFFNVAPAFVTDKDGNNGYFKSLKPEHANQYEGGVKANLFNDKLQGTFSVYDITVSNKVMTDPANPNSVVQGGEVRSKGFEIEFNAQPVRNLTLIAGYAYNDIYVVKGDGGFYAEPGRAPGGQGPGNLVNLWANYKFTNGPLRYFGIGFGGNYASEYKVVDNSVTGVFRLPSYTLLNGSVYFNNNRFRVTVNVNNIANTTYYIGYWSVNPQKPSAVTASVAYKF
ncbi:iron complex outermembrane receptor protein [Chitinophaga skermanii]|uniref:Iron complex outermembrane receptor protein n=1 Tax=Chitinophaga skermanii TaxID=331697 RepID=A0A327QU53_9BACT|nr:TonB-dependent receptor [Chitinophaga skermanii]RAJ08186.1 iron complex outermembrane receptor protein [Chitinophaga skermanii]